MRVLQVLLEQQVYKEQPALREQQVLAQLVPQVLLAQLVPQVRKEIRVLLVPQVLEVRQDLQVISEQLVPLELKEQLVLVPLVR